MAETPKKAGETEIADTPNPIQVVVKRRANNQVANRDEIIKEFARWSFEQQALHRDERETQDEFAGRYNLAPSTLWLWKNERKYLDAVRELAADSLLPHAASVYGKIVDRAKLGDPTMTKLYLQQAKLLEAEKSQHQHQHVHIDLEAFNLDKPSE